MGFSDGHNIGNVRCELEQMAGEYPIEREQLEPYKYLLRSQLLVGRVLNYIYIGMELSTVPVYQSEVVPAPIRGLMVGSYQFSLGIGGLIINGICKRTSTIPSNASWMIPYGLYFIIPTFVASCVWFIPEVSTARIPSLRKR